VTVSQSTTPPSTAQPATHCRFWCIVDRDAEPGHGALFGTCMSAEDMVPLSLADPYEIPGVGTVPEVLTVMLLQDGSDDAPRIETGHISREDARPPPA